MRWLGCLLLLSSPVCFAADETAAPAAVPSDLVGQAGPPTLAWHLEGVAPGATITGFPTAKGADLLVGGPRVAGREPRLGDVAIVSPDGYARRRLATPGGIRGLPAMVRQVVLAGGLEGDLRLWPLVGAAREGTPPRVEVDQQFRVGPLVVGDDYLFAAEQFLYAVSALLEIRWRRELTAPVETPLASDGSRVFASAGGQLAAFALADGAPAWSVNCGARIETALLATAGQVIAGLDDGTLRAYDAATGDPLWSTATAESPPFGLYLALAGPWVFCTTQAGQAVALDALTGARVWSAERPGPLSSPTIAFGTVFVVNGEGQLLAVPVSPGAEAWTYGPPAFDAQPEPLVGSPCVFGHRIYVTTAGGRLLALNLTDASGPAPWPTPGGDVRRNGRVIPPDETD